ncbi:dnaJ homolog subfamily B member 9 [Centroberyx affinis]|uniref:dnaJ homolog subfamily B member 9 n=1 Tax=Centroberyx affinis TaxID=166261 RepID=UPI003A5C2E76
MAMQGVSPWMLASLWVAVVLLCLSGAQTDSSEMSRNYYDTLNVQRTATDRQIKKAFHKLAIKYHPDKNKSTDAEKTFREIAEAYGVLSNKEKRRQYDQLGHEAFLQNESDFNPEAEHETSFFDFGNFENLFLNLHLDDDPFLEEPHYHWRFPLDLEDEDDTYEQYSFSGTDFFDPLDVFYSENGGEEEQERFY